MDLEKAKEWSDEARKILDVVPNPPSSIIQIMHPASAPLPTDEHRLNKQVVTIPVGQPVLSRVQRHPAGEGGHCERVQAGAVGQGEEQDMLLLYSSEGRDHV